MSTARALVFTLLQHAEDFPWRVQETGLLGLRLDARREFRLHVWDSTLGAAHPPPIHDHPYDFTSTVIVGELTNTRYVEDATGEEYLRVRYSPPDEEQRRSDTVRLTATAETLGDGDEYRQLAHELHASWPPPGTVTLMQCSWGRARELTVCLREEAAWCSGQARDATRQEIKSVAAKALQRF